MIGACLTLRGSPPFAIPVKPASGVLNGRTVTSSFASSPRISYKSKWWEAILYGGFAGWCQLITRGSDEYHLSISDRNVKILEVKSAIGSALKSTGIAAGKWREEFHRILENAAWHAVDVDSYIRSIFQTMTEDELIVLRKACGSDPLLKFLQFKIAERVKEIGIFKDQIFGEFFKSAALYSEGYLLQGFAQIEHWKRTDQLVETFGTFHLRDKVASVISDSGLWKLLPFAEHHSKKNLISSPVLEEFCRQAFIKIRDGKLTFSELNDAELGKLAELFENPELAHHASACAAEIKKRQHYSCCMKLTMYFENQLSSVLGRQDIASKNKALVFAGDPFEALNEDEIISVALNVIRKSDPADVVKLSKLESEKIEEIYLTEAARFYLQNPDAKAIGNAQLIAALKLLPFNFSDISRREFVEEAANRAKKVFHLCFEVLAEGLKSGSCDELVHAVREFSALRDTVAELEGAAGTDERENALPQGFLDELKTLAPHKVVRATALVAALNQDKQHQLADQLSKAIEGAPKATHAPLSPKENQFLQDAISLYFHSGEVSRQSEVARIVDRGPGEKLSNIFLDMCLLDSAFRRVRTPELEEIPVCEKFVTDQRKPMQSVNGKPVFVSHLSKKIDKARKFVKEMEGLKGISPAQILMASRIASQSLNNALIQYISTEKWFSLTHEEAGSIFDGATAGWMHPLGLVGTQDFSMRRDGALIAQVRLFNESLKDWAGEVVTEDGPRSVMVQTIPEESSLSVEITIEVDAEGKVRECIIKNRTGRWKLA